MPTQRGFTYIGLLFAIAFISLLLASAGEVWKSAAQREREEELLFAGRQMAQAITSYYLATPGEPRQWPRRLEDLLEDRRGLVMKRHLRRIYHDPMTGSIEWGVIKSGDALVGVYSTSNGVPRKRANFSDDEGAFAGAKSYAGWRFVAQVKDVVDPRK